MYKALAVPNVQLNETVVGQLTAVKYFGHTINCNLNGIEDIDRHSRSLRIRANRIARRFSKCSREVKDLLFKTYCYNLYTGELWFNHRVTWRSLRVCYNDAYTLLYKISRYNSDTLDSLRRSRVKGFLNRLKCSNNSFLSGLFKSDLALNYQLVCSWLKLCFP